MPEKDTFEIVFLKLKKILEPYGSKLIVSGDSKTGYSVETPHVLKNKQHLWFGGATIRKGYVSFHLMPVYCCPDLLSNISPELKKRMQGKSCFNFKEVDEKLFKELAKLTKAGYKRFTDEKFLKTLPM